jgi:hypothetical protein
VVTAIQLKAARLKIRSPDTVQNKNGCGKVMTCTQPGQNDSQWREPGENAVADSKTSAKQSQRQPARVLSSKHFVFRWRSTPM